MCRRELYFNEWRNIERFMSRKSSCRHSRFCLIDSSNKAVEIPTRQKQSTGNEEEVNKAILDQVYAYVSTAVVLLQPRCKS